MRLKALPILTGIALFMVSCNNNKEELPANALVGTWKVDSASITEYLDGKEYFSISRYPDSVILNFEPDNVYTSYDKENCIDFTAQGQHNANFVEGGIWIPEENYSKIRLDKNVPEFNGLNPSILNVAFLNENHFNYTYKIDLRKFLLTGQKSKDSTAYRFAFYKGFFDGSKGGPQSKKTFEAGKAFGKKTGYELGYYARTGKVITAKYAYYFGAFYGFFYEFAGTYPDYDQGFNMGYSGGEERKWGYPKGTNDGIKDSANISNAHITYTFKFYNSKLKGI